MKNIDINELSTLLEDTTATIALLQDNIEINTRLETLVCTVMQVEFCSVWIFDVNEGTLFRERTEHEVQRLSMLGQKGVIAKSFLTLQPAIYNYLASEKEYFSSIDNHDNIRMKSQILMPMLDGEKFIGMVTGYSSVRQVKKFVKSDIKRLEVIVPFLIKVIYRMHPTLRELPEDKITICEAIKEESQSIVEHLQLEERKPKQEESQDIEKVLRFLSNSVHDIRTPANTLYGFLELLEEELEGNARLVPFIKNAKESASFINDLTTAILDKVSMQNESTAVKIVPISPAKYFADITANFSANMFGKKITFNIYIDPLMPQEVLLDTITLKRVLMNLLGNAYKFTPLHRTIDFSVEYDKETKRLFIAVADAGIGIADDKQEAIFEAFHQAQEDTYENYGGTGLGLSICSSYVQSLGGTLSVESELDVGSTFSFSIPVEVSNADAIFTPIRNKDISIGILLADENIFSTQNILRYLLQMGVLKQRIGLIDMKNIEYISHDLTHLICFQHQLNEEVQLLVEKYDIDLLVIEESFLSLLKHDESNPFSVMSAYTYSANILHKFISNTKQIKVLIVDDDRINIQLIEAILEGKFCRIKSAMDGEKALNMLKYAVSLGEPYSLVYLDQNMPKLKGDEVLEAFRKYEKEYHLAPIYAVHISGDMQIADNQQGLFNSYLGKPFNKKKIEQSFQEGLNH